MTKKLYKDLQKIRSEDVELSLDMYIAKFKGEWFHSGCSIRTPMGWDAPVGPFKTFKAAVKDFALNFETYYVDSFKDEEKVK